MESTVATLLALGYVPMLAAFILFLYFFYKKGNRVVMPPTRKHSLYQLAEDLPDEGDPPVLEDEAPSRRDYDYEGLKTRICTLMEREKLYLNPHIRVTDLAEKLYTNKNYIAQALKLKMDKNFCQMVHYYRIREAMRVYALNPELTMRELARRVGFNSMTTFNAAFSRNTGYTPAEWCKEFRRQNDVDDGK